VLQLRFVFRFPTLFRFPTEYVKKVRSESRRLSTKHCLGILQ
jgi:hypothetical protein